MSNQKDVVSGTITDIAETHRKAFDAARDNEGFGGSINQFVEEKGLPRFTIGFNESTGLEPRAIEPEIAAAAGLGNQTEVLAEIDRGTGALVRVTPRPY